MIDFDGTLNAAISSTLGDEKAVIFLPKAGGSFAGLLGVFTLITDHIFDDAGESQANVTVATLGVQVSQFSAMGAPEPIQSDVMQVGGVAYVVKDVAIDGLGWAYMDLGKQ
ncbi:hypothetical protein LMG28688_01614 [Paraburkholderia caffeinitolerans]|uniref:Bacteriophage protein n=1 Tax=Paraburkholderia caffeinitolerans TaxID=1723730 RepID=A0A6J5FMZ7_9BURK|nr:hypothetical protein [Paraburkholderia caffeinitolerans]CAB3783274.1 hypothetical protein LMG28688_01614 [Paraburkholderia caffeinitolerans]